MFRTFMRKAAPVTTLVKFKARINSDFVQRTFSHANSGEYRSLTIRDYYCDLDSNSPFNKDVEKVMKDAQCYFDFRVQNYEQLKPKYKLAVVLDIDETSLNAYRVFKQNNFSFTQQMIDQYYLDANAPAITPVLNFYKNAQAKKVSLFFITARKPIDSKVDLRPSTMKNLETVGYSGYAKLFLPQANDTKIPTATFKTNIRKQIEADGYKIILNIGDQQSDFDGGYAERIFKIPNHLYDSSKPLPNSFQDFEGRVYSGIKFNR